MILLVENIFPSCFESSHRNNSNYIHAVLNVLGHLFAYETQLNINPSLVLVQPRKTRPFITEKLLMGHKESNQTHRFVC